MHGNNGILYNKEFTVGIEINLTFDDETTRTCPVNAITEYSTLSEAMPEGVISVGNVIPSEFEFKIIKSLVDFDPRNIDYFRVVSSVAPSGLNYSYDIGIFYRDSVIDDGDTYYIHGYDCISLLNKSFDISEDAESSIENRIKAVCTEVGLSTTLTLKDSPSGHIANSLALKIPSLDYLEFRTASGAKIPPHNFSNYKSYLMCLAGILGCNIVADRTTPNTLKLVSPKRKNLANVDFTFRNAQDPINNDEYLEFVEGATIEFIKVKFKNYYRNYPGMLSDGTKNYIITINDSAVVDPTHTKRVYKFGRNPLLDPSVMTIRGTDLDGDSKKGWRIARDNIAYQLNHYYEMFSMTLPPVPCFDVGDTVAFYDTNGNQHLLYISSWSFDGNRVTLSCGDAEMTASSITTGGGGLGLSNSTETAQNRADNADNWVEFNADVVKYSSETEHEYNGSLTESSSYGSKIDDLILDHKLEVAGIKQISDAMYGIDNGDGTYTHYAKMYLIDLFPIIPAGSGAGSSDGISFGSTFVGHEVLDYVDDHGNVHKKSSGKRGLWTIVHSGYCAEVIVKIVSPFKCVVCMTNGAWTDNSYQSPAYSRMDTTITDDDSLSYYNTYSISSYAWSDDARREVETYTDYNDWEPNPKPEYASGKCFAFMGLELVDGEIIAHPMSFANGNVYVTSTGAWGTYSIDLLADSDGYYGTVKDILSGGETYKIKATDGIYCAGDRPDNNGSFTFETITDIWSYEYIDTYTRGMRKYNAGHAFYSSTNYYNNMCLSAMEPVLKWSTSELARPSVEMLRSKLANEQACYVPMFYCDYTSETISTGTTYTVAAVEGYESEFVELFNYVSEIAITKSITPNTIDSTFAHALIGGGGNTATPLSDFTAYLDILGNENTATGLQNGTQIIGSGNSLAYDSNSLYDGNNIIVGNDNAGIAGSGSGVFIGNAGNGLYIQNIDGNVSTRDVIIYKGYQEVGRVITDSTYSVSLSSDATNLYLIQEIDGTQEVVSTIPWTDASGVFYTKTEIDALLDAKADIGDIPTALSAFTDDLGDNPVHTHSQYLTEHQSLSNYYTKTETDDLLDDKADASTTYSKTEVDNLLTSHDYTEGTNIDITSRVISLDIPIVEDDSGVPNGAYFAEFDENASNGEWASAQDVQALSTSVNSLTVTVNQKADIADVYTRAQVTDLLSGKADVDDIPTVPTTLSSFTDDLGSNPVHTHSQYLTEHQSLSDYYTKTQTDTLLDAKADASSVYTKTETDGLLDAKQDTLTFDNAPTESSTKPVTSGGVYTALSNKADSNSVYTITQTDENFTKKPLYIIPQYDSSTETYSITETNGEIKQALAEGRKVLLLRRNSTAVDSDGHYRYYPLNVEQYRYTPTASLSALRAYYYEFELDTHTNSVIKTNYYLRVFNNDDEDVPTIEVTTETVTDTNTQEVYVINASVNGPSDITFSDTFANVHDLMESGYTVVLDDGRTLYTLRQYTNNLMLFVATVWEDVYVIRWNSSSGGSYSHKALQPEIQVYNRSTIDESGISNSTVYMVLEDE